MRIWLTVSLLILGCTLFAQSELVLAESYENEPLTQVFAQISEKHGVEFFYQQKWIDTVTVNQSLSGLTVSEALDELFAETTLTYYKDQGKYILLNNVVIIDQPSFLNNFRKKKLNSQSTQGLVFSREYADQTSDQSDLENYVFEIGSRSNKTENATLAGYVSDVESGDPVEGAFVYVQNPTIGTTTDADGFYSLTLPTGKHQIFIQFHGMKTTTRNIILFSYGKLDVKLEIDIIALQEVTVEADRDKNISNVQMGVSKISTEEVKTVPIVLGENDIMKIATTKAGGTKRGRRSIWLQCARR